MTTETIEGFPLVRVKDWGCDAPPAPNAIRIAKERYLIWDEEHHTVTYEALDFHGHGTQHKMWVRTKTKEFVTYLARRVRVGLAISVTPGEDTHAGWETA